MRERTTKRDIRSDFAYVRHLMRVIDGELKKPTTVESLDRLQELVNEITAASASSLTYYIEEQRDKVAPGRGE
jgi:hypothetical protein